jgi:hypothetical protein
MRTWQRAFLLSGALVGLLPLVVPCQSVIEVPFLFKDKSVIVTAEADQKHKFLIGVSLFEPSTLDIRHPAFSRLLRKSGRRQLDLSGTSVITTFISALKIGDFLVKDLEVLWGQPQWLGYNFFKLYPTQIDYASSTLTFFKDRSFEDVFSPTGGSSKKVVLKVLPKEFADRKPFCRVITEDILVNGLPAKIMIAIDGSIIFDDLDFLPKKELADITVGGTHFKRVPLLRAKSKHYNYIIDLSSAFQTGRVTFDLLDRRIAIETP